jgi:hypothetical protein
MKYLPSAKSPFWQLLFAVQFFALAYVLATNGPIFQNDTDSVNAMIPLGALILVATFLITALLGLMAVQRHNKTHPKDKLNIFQITPPELMDDDERLTGVTAKATRNVYLYHNVALPILAVVLLFAHPSLPTVVILVGLLTIGHYIAYWIGIKPALQN